MTRADLLALAARVEAADGADVLLDAAIAVAATPGMFEDGGYVGFTGRGDMRPPQPYTGSLDAAALLARKVSGFIADMGDIAADGLPGVCLCISTDPLKHVWGVSTGGGRAPDGRLARAMTAAALRAMAEEAGDE